MKGVSVSVIKTEMNSKIIFQSACNPGAPDGREGILGFGGGGGGGADSIFRGAGVFLSNGKNMFWWQRSLTARQLLHGAKRRKTATLTLSPLLGGSSLGGPLSTRLVKSLTS